MSKNMRVSFYATILNEEDSIKPFLDSLLSQSYKPDEIIIVDGGSTDRTIQIIKSYIKNGAPIRLIIAKGANIAEGRNIGITNCKYDIIASSDGGCILDKDWLKNLINKFDENVDIVSGVYLPYATNLFEKCVGELMYPNIDALPQDWAMPSHRSVAFRKKVPQTIGKTPTRLYRSDDTWFNMEAKRMGFRFRLAKDAKVYWRCRKNLREVFRNVYLDVKSDIENDVGASAVIIGGVKVTRTLLWWVAGILMLLTVFFLVSQLGALLLAPFVLKPMIKLYLKDRSIRKTIYKNLIEWTGMLAVCCGFITGIFGKRITKRAKRRKCQITKKSAA